ncbi:hypothetical protein T03_4084, partial [Trichinella britovi]
LEDISRNFCIACLFSLPDTPTKIALSCTVLESSIANKQLPCAYLNTQGSSTSGTPLKRIDNG